MSLYVIIRCESDWETTTDTPVGWTWDRSEAERIAKRFEAEANSSDIYFDVDELPHIRCYSPTDGPHPAPTDAPGVTSTTFSEIVSTPELEGLFMDWIAGRHR